MHRYVPHTGRAFKGMQVMCRRATFPAQAPPAYTLMMEYQDNALKIRALQEA